MAALWASSVEHCTTISAERGLNWQRHSCLPRMDPLQQLANIWRGPGAAVGKASSSVPISSLPLLMPLPSSDGTMGTLFKIGTELSEMQLATASESAYRNKKQKKGQGKIQRSLFVCLFFCLFFAFPLSLWVNTSHVSPSLKLLCVFTLLRFIIHARQECQLIRTAFI